MDKNSATYKVAIETLRQSADEQTGDYSWFITTIMRLVALEENISLVDFLIILKEEIPRTNEIFNYYDEKLFYGTFSKFIEDYILVSKE